MAVLNQDQNRAFALFELTPANEISLPEPNGKTMGKRCIDPLGPPPKWGGQECDRLGPPSQKDAQISPRQGRENRRSESSE